jgi:hypothetical protein
MAAEYRFLSYPSHLNQLCHGMATCKLTMLQSVGDEEMSRDHFWIAALMDHLSHGAIG